MVYGQGIFFIDPWFGILLLLGLSTPRGSGTNGYVQKNLGFVKPRPKLEYRVPEEDDKLQLRRKPNQEILEHEKKRELELHVMMWAEEQHLFDGK